MRFLFQMEDLSYCLLVAIRGTSTGRENWDPKLKWAGTFWNYWMFAARLKWERIKMCSGWVWEADPPLCISSGTWSQIKIGWRDVKTREIIMWFARMTVHVTMPKLYFRWLSLHLPVDNGKAVKVAQAKYRKQHSKVNKKVAHPAIAESG